MFQPDVVLLDICSLEDRDARRFVELCHDRKLPVLAAVSREAVSDYDPSLNADEMVVCPVSEGELTARVKQAMYRVSGPAGPQLLTAGDLSIDLERYEVTVAGRRVSLTYKEFQLLVLQDGPLAGQRELPIPNVGHFPPEANGNVHFQTNLPFLEVAAGQGLEGVVKGG